MRRASTLLIAATAGVALLAGGLALAGAGARGGRSGGAGWLGRMARQLDLTDSQRAQIRGILAKHWSAGLSDAADRARLARRGFRDAVADPSADEAKVRDAARKAAAAAEEFAVARHAALAEAFAVLTPEQQERARTWREARRERGDRAFDAIDRALRDGS